MTVDCRVHINGARHEMLSKLRFLVADDHEFQRDLITSLLLRHGAQAVYGAHDGTSALKATTDEAHPVDIVVLDMAMPGMDGVELIQSLGDAPRFVHAYRALPMCPTRVGPP